MTVPNYSSFHKFMQKIPATRIGAWYFSHTQPHFDRLFLKQTDGRTNMTTLLIGTPIVAMTTIGAKSGLQRTSSLVCIRNEQNTDIFAVVASNWGKQHYPAWYHNLKANPRATCSINGQTGEYQAHEAEGAEYERFWQCAIDTYAGFPSYKLRVSERDIPIMVMTPITE